MRDARLPTLPHFLWVALTLLPALGCLQRPASTTSALPTAVRQETRKVKVVGLPQGGESPPQVGGQIGKGSATGKGAFAGAGGGALAGLMVSAQTGPFAVFLAPILVPVGTVIGAGGGAVIGFANGIPEAKGKALEETLARNQSDLCSELARRVTQRLALAGMVAPAEGEVEDLRLEVSVDRWGMFGGTGSSPMGDLQATITYRVLPPQGPALRERHFLVGGARRPFSEWSAGDVLLQQALEGLLDSAAESVVDGAFLVQDLYLWNTFSPWNCGLKHLDPPATYMAASPMHSWQRRVGGLQPRLQWEAFPRTQDAVAGAEAFLKRITDVGYDLRIWRSVGGGPGELVYQRQNLRLPPMTGPAAGSGTSQDLIAVPAATPGAAEPATEVSSEPRVGHVVEVPLSPGTEYLWSVRARFRFDGEVRVTRWSMNPQQDFRTMSGSARWMVGWGGASAGRLAFCREDGIPPLHHHRFSTP